GAEEQTAVYLERAGDRAHAMSAYAEAQAHYQELLARLRQLGRASDAARAGEKLGMVLRTTAHYAAAQAEFEQAAAVYQQHGDLEGLARPTAQSGWIHSLSGTSSAGISRLQATLDRVSVPTTPAASLAELCVALAVLYDDTGQYGAALAAAEQAAEFARAAHATQLLGQAQR